MQCRVYVGSLSTLRLEEVENWRLSFLLVTGYAALVRMMLAHTS